MLQLRQGDEKGTFNGIAAHGPNPQVSSERAVPRTVSSMWMLLSLSMDQGTYYIRTLGPLAFYSNVTSLRWCRIFVCLLSLRLVSSAVEKHLRLVLLNVNCLRPDSLSPLATDPGSENKGRGT